jgi:hypothetical protein
MFIISVEYDEYNTRISKQSLDTYFQVTIIDEFNVKLLDYDGIGI